MEKHITYIPSKLTKIFAYVAVSTIVLALVCMSALDVSKVGAASMSTQAKNLAGLIAVDSATGDDGFGDSDQDLGDLIVLNGLFPSTSTQARNLAGLIAVDNTIGKGSGEDLADLIVLNGLFPNTSTQAANLAGLIAVDSTFDGDGGFGDDDDLSDLIVLNSLFDP